jgi:sugar phosphate isomerase/epimerase
MPVLGVQTFTIRRDMKTPAAIDASFARLAAMGLSAVELAYIRWRPEIVQAVQAAADRHGIAIASSQITFKLLDARREAMLQFHEQLDCRTSAVSVLPWPAILGGAAQMLRFAGRLDALGAWYRERGLQLCFHHHDFELRNYGDETGLALLLRNTEPANVALELDTYWAARGGFSPQALIDRLQGRVRVVHLRDFRLQRGLVGPKPSDAALGRGNLDIAAIVAACEAQSVQHMAIEQASDKPWDGLAASVAHLRALGYDRLLTH